MILVAQFRGIGIISDCIKLLSYSIYSHSAVLFTEDMEVEVSGSVRIISAGNVIEAWKGGVRLSESLSANHTPGTRVDLFKLKTPLTPHEEKRIARFLVSNIGKKYDYINVLRFVPIVRLLIPTPAPSIWTRSHVFCSELVLEAFADAGRPLLDRCRYWEVPPRDPPRSPLLMTEKTVTTT